MNENKSIWGFIVVKSNSFVRILEEALAWKKYFDFVWPLVNDQEESNIEVMESNQQTTNFVFSVWTAEKENRLF